MPKFMCTGTVEIEVEAIVEAENEEAAKALFNAKRADRGEPIIRAMVNIGGGVGFVRESDAVVEDVEVVGTCSIQWESEVYEQED